MKKYIKYIVIGAYILIGVYTFSLSWGVYKLAGGTGFEGANCYTHNQCWKEVMAEEDASNAFNSSIKAILWPISLPITIIEANDLLK